MDVVIVNCRAGSYEFPGAVAGSASESGAMFALIYAREGDMKYPYQVEAFYTNDDTYWLAGVEWLTRAEAKRIMADPGKHISPDC